MSEPSLRGRIAPFMLIAMGVAEDDFEAFVAATTHLLEAHGGPEVNVVFELNFTDEGIVTYEYLLDEEGHRITPERNESLQFEAKLLPYKKTYDYSYFTKLLEEIDEARKTTIGVRYGAEPDHEGDQ